MITCLLDPRSLVVPIVGRVFCFGGECFDTGIIWVIKGKGEGEIF